MNLDALKFGHADAARKAAETHVLTIRDILLSLK
jgi:hypothetical protein